MFSRRYFKQRLHLIIIACWAMALISGFASAAEGTLRVAGTVPLPGELLGGEIIIFFAEDVDLAALTAPPASFAEARIPGEWIKGPNYIALRSEGFPDDRPVIVRLNPDLRAKSGAALDPASRELAFAKFPFGADMVFLHEDKADALRIGMRFRPSVTAAALREHLTAVDSAGRPLKCTVEEGRDEHLHVIALPGKPALPLTLTLTPGLTDTTGYLSLNQPQPWKFPTEASLSIQSLVWGESGDGYHDLRVTFSSTMDPSSLADKLRIEDSEKATPVSFEAQQWGEDATVTIRVLTGNQGRLRLKTTFLAGLTATDRSSLPADAVRVVNRDPNPFIIENNWWSTDNREGLSLRLSFNEALRAADFEKNLRIEPAIANLKVSPQGRSSIALYGDWQSQQAYTITVAADMPYAYGASTLANDLTLSVMTESLDPFIGFSQEGKIYFPKRAAGPLALETRNEDRVKLTLYRLFPSNIAVALRTLYSGDSPDYDFMDTWCKEVASTEVNTTPGRDRLVQTPIDLATMFKDSPRGVFCVTGSHISVDPQSGGGGYWDTGKKLVVWTNIGLLAHWRKDELVLFAHDLETLAPLPDAKVTIYSSKNQVLGKGTTDASGACHLTGFRDGHGAPKVAVVETADDYTFLQLDRRDDDPVAYDTTMPAYDRKGYDAFLYADRDIYRPGETAHLHWLARTNYGDALPDVPLQLVVKKPNGRVLSEEPVTLSALGTGGKDLVTERAWPTGEYTAELRVPGKEVPIGTYAFKLEDFVPNRIKATAVMPEPRLASGKDYQIAVSAEHLFGAPASNRKATLGVVLMPGAFTSDAWKGFRFANDSAFKNEIVDCGDQTLDAEGKATFAFRYEAPPTATFPMRAVAVARVFELGGRAVVSSAESMLFPSDICLGIAGASMPDGGVDVQLAAVMPDEAPAALDKVNVVLEKQAWNYYVRRFYSNYEANWSEEYEAVETREVVLTGGKGAVSFKPTDYGYYRLKVSSPATKQYSTISFYCDGGRCQIVEEARPSLIKLALDKTSYAPGEVAKLRIESPFDGQGFIVIQGDSVQQILAVTVKDGVALADIPVTQAQFPNAWIEATVVHAIEVNKKQVYPFSSFAMANLAVTDASRQLAVAFDALPVEIRPAGPAEFVVKVVDAAGTPVQAELTLAAVDEGIHLVTNYRNPDPIAWVGRHRQPEFNRAHYYDKIAYNFEAPAPGGDLESLIGKRTASPDENWIKPVSLWTGSVQTGADGVARVAMDIPEFTGQLRLVAVACTAKAMGAKDANVFVRRPYMVRTSMPRFLLPGDTTECVATVYNNSDVPVKALVAWSATGAVQGGQGSQELDVPAHGEAPVIATFTAGPTPGQGSLRWETSVTGADGVELEHLVEEAAMPVRTPAAYQSAFQTTVLKPGETREFKNTQFVDDERAGANIVVSVSPMLGLAGALKYVVDYPHGCVEQTTSRLFPLYLLRQNATLFDEPKELATDEAERKAMDSQRLLVYVQAGIQRLFAMQTTSGGLGYWPGASDPSHYGSIYALHFLALVKNGKDIALPEANYTALVNYVKGIVRDYSANSQDDYYMRAYAVYVLALGGDPEVVDHLARFDTITTSRSARCLLAAALAVATQDFPRVSMYLAEKPSEPYAVAQRSGALITPSRDQAVELLAMLEINAPAEQTAALAKTLSGFLDERGHGTTQETAFIIAALSRYLTSLQPDAAKASGNIIGSAGSQDFAGNDVGRMKHDGVGAAFTVKNTGQTELFIAFTSQGVPLQASTATVSEGLTAERVYYTSAGEQMDPTAGFVQGESYVVGLTVNPAQSTEYAVIVDLLPAGLEIENPRLTPDAAPDPKFDASITPSWLDSRDDRIVLAFDSLAPGKGTFYYVVRAVTPGQYQHPGLSAECMYDPSVRAATPAGTMSVK